MSIALMQMVWGIDLASGEKLVLLALADKANDDGKGCWPSVETICTMTGQGERTVRRALAELEKAKHITRSHREGTSTQYHVHPCQFGTPAKSAPLPKTTKTPANLAPKPSRTTNEEEAKASPSQRARAKPDEFPCPDGVDLIDWQALKANRKAKRAPLTEGAHRQIIRKLEGWARSGWPPGPIIANAAERGWTTVFETDEMKGQGNGRTIRATRSAGADRRSSLARAIDEGLDWLDRPQAIVS